MSKEITLPKEPISLGNAFALVQFAQELKGFIVEQKLYTNIKGKNFVQVEGWQFLFMATGTTPVIQSLDRVETDGSEIKYRAVVDLIKLDTQQVVGRGIAICSNKEDKKKSFDEFAVASMAQTRAIGKSGRSVFGFIMKAAGYEATPAEEVVYEKQDVMTQAEKEEARVKDYIEAATSAVELTTACQAYIDELEAGHRLKKLYSDKIAELEAANVELVREVKL